MIKGRRTITQERNRGEIKKERKKCEKKVAKNSETQTLWIKIGKLGKIYVKEERNERGMRNGGEEGKGRKYVQWE